MTATRTLDVTLRVSLDLPLDDSDGAPIRLAELPPKIADAIVDMTIQELCDVIAWQDNGAFAGFIEKLTISEGGHE